MSPMTSRTGPKGRSETTFVSVTVTESVTVAVEIVGIVLVIPIQTLTPPTTTHPKGNPAHMYYRNLLGEGAGMRPLVGDTCPETE